MKIGWRRPWNGPLGQLFTFHASTQSNFHHTDFFKTSLSYAKKVEASFFHQANMEWMWPFAHSWRTHTIGFQPLGTLIVKPPQKAGMPSFPIFGETPVMSSLDNVNSLLSQNNEFCS